jgi:hypothetical protein
VSNSMRLEVWHQRSLASLDHEMQNIIKANGTDTVVFSALLDWRDARWETAYHYKETRKVCESAHRHDLVRIIDEKLASDKAPVRNLLGWVRSGFPRQWVDNHHGRWAHSDWLELLETVKRTEFWPMDTESMGRLLEELKNPSGNTQPRHEPASARTAPPRSATAGPKQSSASSSTEHSETVAILTDSLVPALYDRNGFRVLDLPADATAREISRRKQTIEKALTHELPIPPGPGRYFPLTPAPDQFAVRDAMQRLSDPERRLIDELFWFWPHRQGQASDDTALSRLRAAADKEAESLWLEQETDHSESSVSTHNLALLYHFRAIEMELSLLKAAPGELKVDGLVKVWDKSFRRWRSLSTQEGFWTRLTSRIRELDDPRLTAGTARRIRAALPSALLSICGQLALQAVEGGRKETASRLVEIINKSGFSESDVKEGLRTAVDPVRNRIKALCKAAELASENDPVHADQACQQLLANAKPLLDGLDCLLPRNHPTRELAYDDVADRALRCQVAFAKKTKDWKRSVLLLDQALHFAASESTRKELQEQLQSVRKNADEKDDFCGEGYYDTPPALLGELEKIRDLAEGQKSYDQAVLRLDQLLAGKSDVQCPAEYLNLVCDALAYCLGCRAAKLMNEAIDDWNACTTSVIGEIQRRGKYSAEPSGGNLHCMACNSSIYGTYTVLTWTFDNESQSRKLTICSSCSTRHAREMTTPQAKFKEAIKRAAQDYVDASHLDAANKFVQGQIERMRKRCTAQEIPFPSPQRRKPKTPSDLASKSVRFALLGILLGPLTAVPAVIYGHKAVSQIRRSGRVIRGRRPAMAGLVSGYIIIALWIFFLIAVVVRQS